MSRSAPTIPIASAGGAPPLSITDQDWSGIEETYGHSLPAEVRQRILEATTEFVYWEVFERTAEPLSLAKERVTSVQRAADVFHRALHGSMTNSRRYADRTIERHFDYPGTSSTSKKLAPQGKLKHLNRVLTSLERACNLALGEMGDAPEWREGECWDQWNSKADRYPGNARLAECGVEGDDQAENQPAAIALRAARRGPSGLRAGGVPSYAVVRGAGRCNSPCAPQQCPQEIARDTKPSGLDQKMSRPDG